MKLSIKTKSVVALATTALIAGGVAAAPNLNSSKSNIYKLDPSNPDAEKQCVEKGGIAKDAMCVFPEGPKPIEAMTVKSSTSNSSERAGATPQPAEEKKICIIYQAGHEGDSRYCSQSVPAPK